MQKQKVLITTAIDYTNDVIHIGQAYEKILADAVARYYRKKLGPDNVFFVTGTDEHGTTNLRAAEQRGISVKEHVKEISLKDQEQIDALAISYDRFIHTTDADHMQVAANFFQKSIAAEKIYKDSYDGLYCEGCEAYKMLNDLNEDGQCELHPTREIQTYSEENYFFKWSDYTNFLTGLLTNNTLQVIPEKKKNEMLAFIENGLQDIPVSRPTFKLPWGIPTPNDSEQVIYVWYDALINYYTTGKDTGFWDEDTHIVHFIGKDIARWHTLLWPAMLSSAEIRLPDTVYVHGFMNLDGNKISKSRGNVIRPTDLVNKYGVDAIRYYLLKNGPIIEDVDISRDHLCETYTADLANGLGNVVARTATLLEKSEAQLAPADYVAVELTEDMQRRWEEYRVDQVLILIWEEIHALDKYIDEQKPWKLLKNQDTDITSLPIWQKLADAIREIASYIEPFMPETAQKIQDQFAGSTVTAQEGLFPRI